MQSDQTIIQHVMNWVREVVVGLNFCPFAGREVENNSIRYIVNHEISPEAQLHQLIDECRLLDKDSSIETTLLIYPDGLDDFELFLDYIELAEALLKEQGYEGIYQVAHFHPFYQFADTEFNDEANYTNRSPYPMLHLIREKSIERVLQHYPDPDLIPERNIELARKKGKQQMQALLESCIKNNRD